MLVCSHISCSHIYTAVVQIRQKYLCTSATALHVKTLQCSEEESLYAAKTLTHLYVRMHIGLHSKFPAVRRARQGRRFSTDEQH